jgi:hypothetical protein
VTVVCAAAATAAERINSAAAKIEIPLLMSFACSFLLPIAIKFCSGQIGFSQSGNRKHHASMDIGKRQAASRTIAEYSVS